MPLNLPMEVWIMLVSAGLMFLAAIVFIFIMRAVVNRGRED